MKEIIKKKMRTDGICQAAWNVIELKVKLVKHA